MAISTILVDCPAAFVSDSKVEAKLWQIKLELRQRLHQPLVEVGAWLRAVLLGHYRYYEVPGNYPAFAAFRFFLGGLWQQALSPRSQTGWVPWRRMRRLLARWLPPPRISHPYPSTRLRVST